VVFILTLGAGGIVGCASQNTDAPAQPALSSAPAQPEAKLLEFCQMKQAHLDQLNTELAALKSQITEAEAKVESEQRAIREETEKVNQKRREQGRPEWHWGQPISSAECSPELIILLLTAGAPSAQLDRLKEQEQKLLAKKQYIEDTITEISQHTKLAGYQQFKLRQLEELTARLLTLKLDLEQQFNSETQQEYNLLLIRRQLLQEDIKQLELLLGQH
jgi:hypothetical protein